MFHVSFHCERVKISSAITLTSCVINRPKINLYESYMLFVLINKYVNE